ncbi:MAG TPA: VWA domain-containing protein [Pyrinomonadaceae bacterium]|jgi:VWFA-related protein
MLGAQLRIAQVLMAAVLACLAVSASVSAQDRLSEAEPRERVSGSRDQRNGGVRSVTIPITIRMTGDKAKQELQPLGVLTLREDGEEQRILSIRAIGSETPISIAILIQDDVIPSIGNEIRPLADFIRRLPKGSRVLVGYIRSGSLQLRQKFTSDLERAAAALRAPVGSATAAPYNPYVEIIEGLRRFEAIPKGRRAMLVVSDGLDTSRGLDNSSPAQSVDLQRAIKEAQRSGVAVYSIYAPSVTVNASANGLLALNGQGSLERLADETGGEAFFQGTGAPVSFDAFLTELGSAFNRQIALTYLSTHPNKGYHRIQISTGRKDIKIDHPSGYTR